MVGASFYRSDDGKCPNCGTFGQQEDTDEDEMDSKICPHCDTVFNRYIVLQQGQDVDFKNN